MNEDRLRESLEELVRTVKVRTVNLTGGEPTLDWDLFLRVFRVCRSTLESSTLVVNTFGPRIKDLLTGEVAELADYVALSRHHYDDDINRRIFGYPVPTMSEIMKVQSTCPDRDLLHLACTLFKGGIDRSDEVFRYLEHASKMGVRLVGLSSLLPVNDFCAQNHVSLGPMDLGGERSILMMEQSQGDACRCWNYVYVPESLKDVVRVYCKDTRCPSALPPILSFDGHDLRVGFDGEVLGP